MSPSILTGKYTNRKKNAGKRKKNASAVVSRFLHKTHFVRLSSGSTWKLITVIPSETLYCQYNDNICNSAKI